MHLYHSTDNEYVDSILSTGLRPDEFSLVYLSTYPMEGYDVTFKVEIPDKSSLYDWRDVWMNGDEYVDPEGHTYDPENPYYVYSGRIPPEYLTIVSQLHEKYERVSTAKTLKSDLLSAKEELQKETDPESLIDKLNRIGYPYDVSFSDEEQYGHEWSFADAGIQLGYILEDGSITIVCDPEILIEYVLYDDNIFPYFARVVASVVNHELIHRDQLENTPFDHQVTRRDLQNSESNFSYLSNTKEIDAHAAEAVSEFLEMGYSKEEIRGWLTSTEKIKYHANESTAFWKYWDYFGVYNEDEDDTWRRFLTRFYDFLEQDIYTK
jgi:hypothetical protein